MTLFIARRRSFTLPYYRTGAIQIKIVPIRTLQEVPPINYSKQCSHLVCGFKKVGCYVLYREKCHQQTAYW